jgi:hypothetical protein
MEISFLFSITDKLFDTTYTATPFIVVDSPIFKKIENLIRNLAATTKKRVKNTPS